MTFERALEVEFLQPLHRGASDAGSVLGDSSGRAHGAAIGPCPGCFCGLARIDESDATDGAPADQAQRLFRAMRSAVEESKREACTGEALDFWPDELIRWCLKTSSTRCDQPRPLLDLQWSRPSIFLAHPTQDTQACPGQTLEIRWVCRGPPPPLLRIDVEFVPTESTVEDEFLVTTREVIKRIPGSQQSLDWVVPPDLNGTSSNGLWRLHLRIVFEDEYGDESDAAILCSSQPFSVQKTHALLQHGRLPAVDLRADSHDVQSAIGALRVLDERRAQRIGEERVRRWDKCAVCQNCAEVHADLSARRARYLASSNERKAQKEAGLLLLREQDENDMSGDRKGLKAAERRRRRRNVLRALAEPRNRREKVQEPVFTTTKPSERPTAFDDNLPRVASTRPRESPFIAQIKQKAAVLREEAAQATWAASHSRPAPSPPKVPPPPTPTAKLGSSLLNALDGGASHFEPQDSLASVFGTVQPERGEDSLRSVFGGASPRKPRRRRPKRKPRTYADLLHPWQRLLRDQIDTVVAPEPPAAPNPDALLDSLLDMAEEGSGGDGLSYF
jgi:hypothetical protein